MSAPFSQRYSYANVVAGTRDTPSNPDTPLDQTPNVATYAQAPYIPASQARISRTDAFDPIHAIDGTNERRSIDDMALYHARQTPTSSLFFIPSYLNGSRYIDRLQAALQARQEEEEDDDDNDNQYYTSSPVHTSSAPHMHRGVAQNIVERPPAHEYEGKLRMLPTGWSEHDKAVGLELLGDGTEIRFAGVQKKIVDEAASIRTNNPIPRDVGLYYYEVSILSRGKDALIGVGFSSRKTTLTRLPGWEAESYAYHGDDGDVYSGGSNGLTYGPQFSSGDVVGCGVNFRTNRIFFTKNGILLGNAFDLKQTHNLYPCIGIKKTGEHLRANFGKQPFVFDIDTVMRHETRAAQNSVNQQAVDKLHPPDNEKALIQRLVSQYLAHEGYIETSRAFLQDLRHQRRRAPSTAADLEPDDDDDNNDNTTADIHAVNRQRIRQAVLYGDINKALNLMKSCYPQVLHLDRNRDTYFRLRCQRFIEMIRRYSDLSTATNGVHHMQDEHKDTQMELDDQIQRETLGSLEDTDMDGMLDPVSSMKQHDVLSAAIEYGQGLRAEFEGDAYTEHQKELSEIFALVAYEDAKASPVGHLLDKSRRASIAEELNGAILVSLGQPSSAALEKLCSQTETFLDETASKIGGAAALINLRTLMQC